MLRKPYVDQLTDKRAITIVQELLCDTYNETLIIAACYLVTESLPDAVYARRFSSGDSYWLLPGILTDTDIVPTIVVNPEKGFAALQKAQADGNEPFTFKDYCEQLAAYHRLDMMEADE